MGVQCPKREKKREKRQKEEKGKSTEQPGCPLLPRVRPQDRVDRAEAGQKAKILGGRSEVPWQSPMLEQPTTGRSSAVAGPLPLVKVRTRGPRAATCVFCRSFVRWCGCGRQTCDDATESVVSWPRPFGRAVVACPDRCPSLTAPLVSTQTLLFYTIFRGKRVGRLDRSTGLCSLQINRAFFSPVFGPPAPVGPIILGNGTSLDGRGPGLYWCRVVLVIPLQLTSTDFPPPPRSSQPVATQLSQIWQLPTAQPGAGPRHRARLN